MFVGDSKNFSATAYLDSSDTQVDSTSTISWQVSPASVLSVVDHGSANGVGACTVTALASGPAALIATATDTDGHSIFAQQNLTVSVAPPPHAVSVVITQTS